ncbi:hypothetical protein PSN45_000725 [Yamadazyma tenuis]|uniref:uncharacterized protein n=1 Tax=Candida tenuis TaxID=2315449 RepID=UPI0027A09B49|nr:hypothetical protein PSN45_000725 [Yamadazyma tenuis]
MIDPRDEVVNSDEELTGDELEELLDLQKEYDLKKQQLLEKKNKDAAGSKTFIEGLNAVAAKPIKLIDLDKRLFEFDIDQGKSEPCHEVDPLSKEMMRTRYHSAQTINETLKKNDIKLLSVNRALAKIVKPDFKEPQYDNWAFFGYIIDKSDFLTTTKNEKYVRFQIGTFTNTISLNLFGDAYKRYWKLIVGELVMVLNPNIYKHTKGFDFFLTENLNSLVVIGVIEGIGKCQAPGCKKYISTKFKLCEYHELQEEKKMLKNKRMELNGSIKLFNPLERSINEESRIYQNRSQFDSSKYFREDILQKQGSKRKLMDARANNNLEKKLMKMSNTPKFEKIGLLKSRSRQLEQARAKTVEAHNNVRDEFRSLTEGKKINLGMSKTDKIAKRNKWSSTVETLKMDQKQVREASRQASKENKRQQKAEESDDDLEIQFTPQQLQSYKQIRKD